MHFLKMFGRITENFSALVISCQGGKSREGGERRYWLIFLKFTPFLKVYWSLLKKILSMILVIKLSVHRFTAFCLCNFINIPAILWNKYKAEIILREVQVSNKAKWTQFRKIKWIVRHVFLHFFKSKIIDKRVFPEKN